MGAPRADSVAVKLAPVAGRLAARIGLDGMLGLRFWDGSELPGAPGAPTAVVRDPRALAYLAREPNELGFGRAWVAGDLDLDGDLAEALSLRYRIARGRMRASDRLAALRAARQVGALPLRPPRPPAAEARLSGRLHSLRRDRTAVRHHYDVSNAFYRMVLGPTMVYSCAYFASQEDDLETAQTRKLDVICRKLRLAEGERLLDIGCGWGSLVLHAARRYGVRAVGITLSEPQAQLARERAAEAGLADRCEVRVADYREVDDGPFDKVASVGMAEHVGLARMADYMATVRRVLRPGGLFLNHAIFRVGNTRPNPKSFIWNYVFPDGQILPLAPTIEAMNITGLEVRDVETLREHYALTLRRWVANLARHRDEAIAEAGPERERVWRLYMTASADEFDRGELSVAQVLAAAPGAPHGLPLAR